MDNDERLGVALSGGGHRAAVFSLGALLYMVDARVSPNVTTISSVSGGSLLNGYLALQRTSFDRWSQDGFEGPAAAFARCIAGNRRRWVVLTRMLLLNLLVYSLLLAAPLNTLAVLTASALAFLVLAVTVGPGCGGFLFGSRLTWLYLVLVAWMAMTIAAWIVAARH